MDEGTPPTAAELGISEAEYGRILRDLAGRRSGTAVPAGPPAPAAHRPAAERPRKLLKTRLPAVLAFLVLVVGLLVRAGGGDDGPAYAFLETSGDQPVAYTSCRQIQVAVYPARGPADAYGLVRDAVARVREATGLDIVVIGPFGGAAPNWNFEAAPVHPDDPISVSWQDGDAIAEMTDHVAGLGASRTMTYPDGRRRLVGGTVALSIDYYSTLEAEGNRAEELVVLMHELGHVFGLDHVHNPGELMNEDNLGRTAYGPGDLAGLRRLGRGPCF